MTTLQTIIKGQSDWQENVNQTIQTVNSLMGGVEPTRLVNPVTTLNGAKIYGESDIYYWNVGKQKLVLLTVGGVDFGKPGDYKLTTPSEFRPAQWVNVPANQSSTVTYRAGVNPDDEWAVYSINDNEVMGTGFSAIYLAN